MRVAICFFGITRNLRRGSLKALERNLLAPVRRLDPAYVRFGHFNLAATLLNPRSKEIDVPLAPDDHLKLGCDHVLTTPQEEVDREIDLSPFRPFGDPWGDDFSSMRNLLRQYYSLERVTQLMLAHAATFDIVIFSRADVRYRSPLPIPEVRPGIIYTPSFAKNEGLNDRFALGTRATMVHYGLRGRRAREYVETTGKPLHAEIFLKWLVEDLGLQNEDLDLYFWRMRANGRPAGLDGHRRHLYRIRAHFFACLRSFVGPGGNR